MIVYHSKNIEEIGARIEWAHFTAGEVEEVHAMLHVEPRCELFEGQMTRIQQAEKIFLEMEDVQGSSIVFISGTASINHKGEVMYVGNVQQQTFRMWENVETLLNEGGMSYEDVMQIIVYLRDSADYEMVKGMFDQKFPHIPTVFTLAPVCRPTWLIEMECMAVKKANNDFRDF